jgi:hypothetical protein
MLYFGIFLKLFFPSLILTCSGDGRGIDYAARSLGLPQELNSRFSPDQMGTKWEQSGNKSGTVCVWRMAGLQK